MKKIACILCKKIRWKKTHPAPFKGAEVTAPKQLLCMKCRNRKA